MQSPDTKGVKGNPLRNALFRRRSRAPDRAEKRTCGADHASRIRRRPDATERALYLRRSEKGGGVVDIFAAPVREYAVGRGRTMHRMVAPAKALRELGQRRGRKISYAAMQDSWAEYASQHLGQQFERGRPKARTRSEHLSPEDYRRSLELAAECDRPRPPPTPFQRGR